MKKRKIPRWLGKAAALVGILAVLVSTLLVPVSAAVYVEDGQLLYRATNSADEIRFFEQDYYSGQSIVYNVPNMFSLNTSATGVYTDYVPQAYIKNPSPNVINIEQAYVKSVSGQKIDNRVDGVGMVARRCETTYLFNSSINQSNSFGFYVLQFYFEDIYLPKGYRESLESDSYNTFILEELPEYYMNCTSGSNGPCKVNVTFNVDKISGGIVEQKSYSYNYDSYIDSGEIGGPLCIDVAEEIISHNWARSYSFSDGDTMSHFSDIYITITFENKTSLIDFRTFDTYYYGETPRDQYYDDYPVSLKIVDHTVDADFGSWIVTSLAGFMDFEIFPGFSISLILAVVIGLSLVMMFLKRFSGG